MSRHCWSVSSGTRENGAMTNKMKRFWMLLHPGQLCDRGIEGFREPYVGGLAGLQLACVERYNATNAKRRGCMTTSVADSVRPGRRSRDSQKLMCQRAN